jgi:hypothetical protein
MNITEFDIVKYGIEGTGIDSHTKQDVIWKDNVTQQITYSIPSGTLVHLWFSPKTHSNRVFVQHGNEVKLSRLETASKRFTGINKCPTMKTLEKYSDCISKSVVGEKVEPDGFGPTGAPSWLLVLGLI